MSASRRLASQADRENEENARIKKEMMEELKANPLMKRQFLHVATTSNSV